MKRNKTTNLTWILSLLFVSSIITGCRYYRSSAPSNPNLGKYLSYQSHAKFAGNHFIIHTGDEMKELINVRVNKKEKTITGELVIFQGLQREYYDKMVEREGILTKRKRGFANRDAVKQFHLYVDQNLLKK